MNFFKFLLGLLLIIFSADLSAQPIIIILCSGKSGSTSLQKSFQQAGFKTYREHRLNENLSKILKELPSNQAVLFIDSTRDIIARKIASFFHHLEKNLKSNRNQILKAYKQNKKLILAKIQKKLDQKITKIAHFQAFTDWKKLGYDCLQDGEFDRENMCQLHQQKNYYFVNLRFDDIASWQEIIQNLPIPFDLSEFVLVAANRAENKWYSDIYHDFKQIFTIERKQFNFIVNSLNSVLDHFYTPQERDNFQRKWAKHILKTNRDR